MKKIRGTAVSSHSATGNGAEMIEPATASMGLSVNPALDVWGYWVDACQRGVLFADVMRQRSERYEEHAAKDAPHVLKFACDLIIDGRKLPRPVNYALVRVHPPKDAETDPLKRPFVVVDPRAGHGPGIGGFKPESEIGVALKAGHPCYFIGFLPEPMPGQTIEDIARAEAAFLERVIALHPEAEGKPAVIGNCQAGWAVMMVAAMRPELFGPIIVAGSPLSYWAGVRGENPMRYTGGLVGGSWITSMVGDMGVGKFDGAWLVTNFENLNPSNTYWSKNHNLYSKIDTEPPRYLEFEQWWGGHVMLNAEEMQFIVDNLFVGNKLATADIKTSDGTRVDLRNISSPIVVFCSKGDNITPPQQALGWILDLYGSVDDIRVHGQTIVYAVHESIGHLGIFVSSSVAKKEHQEFASNIDLIDVLPPGLYEAVLTPADPNDPTADLIGGDYLLRFEDRTLDDIRALGANSVEDERKFAAAARISEINLGLYKTMVQPWVKLWANEGMAEWMRRMHPARLQYEIFSHSNPMWRSFDTMVESVKQSRQPVAENNPYWHAQKLFSDWMTSSLDAYRDARDHLQEEWFHAFYGSPIVQAMVGLKGSDDNPRPKPGDDAAYRILVQQRIEELKTNIIAGGPVEAALRALIYIRMPEGATDARAFNLVRRMREETGGDMSLGTFKQMLREQFFMLLIDERRALEAIPAMLEKDPGLAAQMEKKLHRVLSVVGLQTSDAKSRLAEMQALFSAQPSVKAVLAGKGEDGLTVAKTTTSKSGHASRRQH
jgi:pimeloyl-ACP methyl ester carboxylesterase